MKVNGTLKQSDDLAQQIWSVPQTISFLSNQVQLAPGDLIYSGTPAGVGPVVPEDRIEGHIDQVGDVVVNLV